MKAGNPNSSSLTLGEGFSRKIKIVRHDEAVWAFVDAELDRGLTSIEIQRMTFRKFGDSPSVTGIQKRRRANS